MVEEDPTGLFPGAHFQGFCKSKMMQLLYGYAMRSIKAMPDVKKSLQKKTLATLSSAYLF